MYPYAYAVSNTLYTSNMDVGCSLEPLAASSMTPQHHWGLHIPQFFKKLAPTCTVITVYTGCIHMSIHSILRLQNTLYTSNMDVRCSLKPLAASIMAPQHSLGLHTPQFSWLIFYRLLIRTLQMAQLGIWHAVWQSASFGKGIWYHYCVIIRDNGWITGHKYHESMVSHITT